MLRNVKKNIRLLKHVENHGMHGIEALCIKLPVAIIINSLSIICTCFIIKRVLVMLICISWEEG